MSKHLNDRVKNKRWKTNRQENAVVASMQIHYAIVYFFGRFVNTLSRNREAQKFKLQFIDTVRFSYLSVTVCMGKILLQFRNYFYFLQSLRLFKYAMSNFQLGTEKSTVNSIVELSTASPTYFHRAQRGFVNRVLWQLGRLQNFLEQSMFSSLG